MPSPNDRNKKIAENLVAGAPLAFKAKEDGSMVIIAPSGKKFTFTPEQVQKAAQYLEPKLKECSGSKIGLRPSKPKPKPKAAPTPKKTPVANSARRTKSKQSLKNEVKNGNNPRNHS